MMPDTLPDRSEVANFDATKLKHVETKESNVLPTKDGNEHLKSPYNINALSDCHAGTENKENHRLGGFTVMYL